MDRQRMEWSEDPSALGRDRQEQWEHLLRDLSLTPEQAQRWTQHKVVWAYLREKALTKATQAVRKASTPTELAVAKGLFEAVDSIDYEYMSVLDALQEVAYDEGLT